MPLASDRVLKSENNVIRVIIKFARREFQQVYVMGYDTKGEVWALASNCSLTN